jgi:soluble lytic murein transglycosylase-like protein
MAETHIPTWVWIIGGVLLLSALGTGGVVAVNYLTTAWMASQNAQKWAQALAQAESTFGIPAGLLARIAYQESHFRQDIIDGTMASPAGALGLMQLEPQYFSSVQRATPFTDQDTLDQITEAASFLAGGLYAHFGDWTAATAAYNAGQGAIDKVLAGTRTLPAETATYLQQVSADLPQLISPTLTA